MKCIFTIGLLALLSAGVAFSSIGGAKVLRQHGFEDFSQGTQGNSGANLYVSRGGRIQVTNTWDLNNDGYVDLLFTGDHDVYETVDALIYWGGERGYSSLLPSLWSERPLAQVIFDLMDEKASVSRLPTYGGGKSLIADLNRDGYPDIVFCNYIHYHPGLRTAYIYWGGPTGYSVDRRTDLPTNWAAGVAAADLNGDGYPDLVFANEGVEPGLENISTPHYESYIYWGGPGGFDPARRTSLATHGARDVTIADINKDGYPDIALINNSKDAQDIQIFWGSTAGYSSDREQIIPVSDPNSIRSGDVNSDGFPDLVVTTGGKPVTIVPNDLRDQTGQSPAYIFPGSAKGIDSERAVLLPAYQARDSWIGDLNGDGFADIALANSSDSQSPITSSFVYWGSKSGFSADRRTELPTLGATAVTAADLNHDGHLDLIFANSSDGKKYDVPSYIYWGSATGFAPYLRSDLQGFGAESVNVADLNRDGNPDVLLVNRYSGTVLGNDVATHIFWGNPDHYYSTASMTSLPGNGAYGSTLADLNDDGFPDIVQCNLSSKVSYIYWGGKNGFSTERRTELPVEGAFVSHAADLNRDGYLDLIISSTVGDQDSATIFWGSPAGFSETNKTVLRLKGKMGSTFLIADLNRDGYLDLVFSGNYFGLLQIFWGEADGFSESRTWSEQMPYGGMLDLADLNGDGYLDFVYSGSFDSQRKSHNARTRILWGTPQGTPSSEGVIELDSYGSCQVAIADLNRDGNLDIVSTNYMSDSTRTLPVVIYWGGEAGKYTNANRTELPSHSSCGLQLVDLNDDGYPEIVVHNHLNGGRHTNDSYIYWNGPQGFDKNRRTDLPNFGPHYSQMLDVGNLYTRKLEEDYVSAPLMVPEGTQPHQISWQANEPHGAKLKFQIKSAVTQQELTQAKWQGPNGDNSFYQTSGVELQGIRAGNRWLQYKAVFTSPDGGDWPVLTEVEIGLL